MCVTRLKCIILCACEVSVSLVSALLSWKALWHIARILYSCPYFSSLYRNLHSCLLSQSASSILLFTPHHLCTIFWGFCLLLRPRRTPSNPLPSLSVYCSQSVRIISLVCKWRYPFFKSILFSDFVVGDSQFALLDLHILQLNRHNFFLLIFFNMICCITLYTVDLYSLFFVWFVVSSSQTLNSSALHLF